MKVVMRSSLLSLNMFRLFVFNEYLYRNYKYKSLRICEDGILYFNRRAIKKSNYGIWKERLKLVKTKFLCYHWKINQEWDILLGYFFTYPSAIIQMCEPFPNDPWKLLSKLLFIIPSEWGSVALLGYPD